MTELGTRSGSQILRTFLPQQTADLKGGIYKVTEWSSAVPIPVDQEIVSRRLLREITPWARAQTDNGFAADLRRGANVEVVELDDRRGVTVERFPEVWLCRNCRRIGKERSRNCRCGVRRWGQLHFVGFHSCGALVEPWIKRCQQHDDVMLVSPKSAQAKDIRFVCPECQQELMKGLGFRQCLLAGQREHQLERSQGPQRIRSPRRRTRQPAKTAEHERTTRRRRPPKSTAWLVAGMPAPSPALMDGKPTRGTFIQNLLQQGMNPDFAEKMAALAAEDGQLAPEDGTDDIDLLTPIRRQEAEHEAVDIAMALAEGHIPTSGLIGAPGLEATLSARYENDYPAALAHAGLAGVNLVERFPVLNIMYGYTRGGGDAGESRLIPFRHPRGGYRLYGDLSETEALYFRLDPVSVARWLSARGHALPGWSRTDDQDPRRARIAILEAAEIPPPGDEPAAPSIRQRPSDPDPLLRAQGYPPNSVFAGIDRDALAEYLVPLNLGLLHLRWRTRRLRSRRPPGRLRNRAKRSADQRGRRRTSLRSRSWMRTRSRSLPGMPARRRTQLSVLQHLSRPQVTIR